MSLKDAAWYVEEYLPDLLRTLVNENDILCGAINQTNAMDWDIDDFDSLDEYFIDKGEIEFSAEVTYVGHTQIEDNFFCGNTIKCSITGTMLDKTGSNNWELLPDYNVNIISRE